MTERDKVTVDNIIGLVHTDEPTDSVDEVRKLRGRTNERFMVDTTGTLIDMETRDTFDYVSEVVDLLNSYDKENEQLKSENKGLQGKASSWKITASEQMIKQSKLMKEIEQLKQFKEDVFNKIDMHLRMLPTARDNEFNEDDGDPSLYTGAIYMLETLKKELQE